MQEEIDMMLEEAEESMDQSLKYLVDQFTQIRTGKASPAILSKVMVSYYGAPTPLQQVSNVTTSDSRTIVIQAWEKKIIPDIERAIIEANLGLNPQNDGEVVRLVIPPLTEERRKQLAKQAKAMAEDAKVSVRGARKSAMDSVKKAVKDGYPEDEGKKKETEIQNLTDSYIKKIEGALEKKEKEIMTV